MMRPSSSSAEALRACFLLALLVGALALAPSATSNKSSALSTDDDDTGSLVDDAPADMPELFPPDPAGDAPELLPGPDPVGDGPDLAWTGELEKGY
ncbi:hypothetical protein BRADI_1g22221v3 [Brachypodium distachyon]|uniref:Uncharacterized protein n=1 Tax=Brachypodium distachyon TaxID=15368 RepID=A0A2K2DKK3_BRADI|nr:hypothetical protein BRADI_1g22221v3 [Brachypodium distachyon]